MCIEGCADGGGEEVIILAFKDALLYASATFGADSTESAGRWNSGIAACLTMF